MRGFGGGERVPLLGGEVSSSMTPFAVLSLFVLRILVSGFVQISFSPIYSCEFFCSSVSSFDFS